MNFDQKVKQNEQPPLDCLEDLMAHVTTAIRIINLGLSIYIIYLCFPVPEDGLSLTTWHVLLYTIGWTFLMVEGIFFVPKENICTSRLSQPTRVLIHWLVLVVATGFIIAGFTVIVVQAADRGSDHFSTNHGLPGAVATILAYVCCINGIPAVFAGKLRKIIKPNINKLFHALVGIAAVLSGAVATVTGFYTGWFRNRSTPTMQNVCYVVLVIITCWLLLKPVINSLVRIKSFCSS
ncbi:transmembrane reductase CYB561D2-like [Onthophagus taurus]|uniref:transmembrane reductase CYB561D2-like n=1 Tax=Onthophagus taurus TaxID=166361 RepID=UPI000C20725A|nr:cytochrome b561 domain-containing protein 2-like [Onthophagus taurus]